jgi:hypothetical protein
VIAIVAFPNEPNNLIAAGKPTGYGQANLVLTINRKGPAFTSFYSELFRRMYQGKTMPMAWAELAPQIPGATHEDCPEGIFLLKSAISSLSRIGHPPASPAFRSSQLSRSLTAT